MHKQFRAHYLEGYAVIGCEMEKTVLKSWWLSYMGQTWNRKH